MADASSSQTFQPSKRGGAADVSVGLNVALFLLAADWCCSVCRSGRSKASPSKEGGNPSRRSAIWLKRAIS